MDWIHDLPHNSPMLNQLGQPGGGQQIGQATKVSISVNTNMNRSIIDICGYTFILVSQSANTIN